MTYNNKAHIAFVIIAPPGNICFVLSEIYESEAAVANHIKLSMETVRQYCPLPLILVWG